MDILPPVLTLAGCFLVVLLLMRLGWRSRARRHADLPEPAPVPAGDDDAALGPLPGVYVSTVLADRPLERVVAHGLGSRSRATITVTEDGSYRLRREGARSFTVPAEDVETLAAGPGMAGKVVGGDGVLVLRWRLGERLLDTGVRLRDAAHHDLLLSRKETS